MHNHVPTGADAVLKPLLGANGQTGVCPHSIFSALRDERPVLWSEALQSWIVTSYDAVNAVVRDQGSFSSASVSRPPLGVLPGIDILARNATRDERVARFHSSLIKNDNQALLGADPPDHLRRRIEAQKWLTAGRARAIAEVAEPWLADLIDNLPVEGALDVAATISRPLPLLVLGLILGISEEDRFRFRALVDLLDKPVDLTSIDSVVASVEAEAEIRAYFAKHLLDARDNEHGLVGGLRSAIDSGRLSEDEAIGICRELIVAGNGSTGMVLSRGIATLAASPELRSGLKGCDVALTAYVEEALRLYSPFNGFFRAAVVDVELAGVLVKAGDSVFVAFSGANHDPALFELPDELDLNRPRASHLAFSSGPHVCVGAHMARMQLHISFRAFVERFDLVTLISGPATDVRTSLKFTAAAAPVVTYVKRPT